jgi:hypothetical protein
MFHRHQTLLVVAGLGAVACQPRFPVERHVLGPFRLAAMGVVQGRAQAAVWSGAGPTHAEAPVLRWSADGVVLGDGQGLAVPAGVQRLSLEVEAPDGTLHEGEVSVSDCDAALSLERAVVDSRGSLGLAAREQWAEIPTEHGATADGEAVRLTASGAGFPGGLELRWMVAGEEATVLELDALRADVFAEQIELDDGELESRRATGAALHHLLALGIDGAGCNRWRWASVPFGEEGPWVVLGEARVAADTEPPDGELLSGWLTINEGVPQLSELAPELSEDPELALPCGDGSAVLDPEWMWSGRCTRDELDGERVLVRVGP